MKIHNFWMIICVVFAMFAVAFVFADPSGATVTPGTSSSAPAASAGSDTNALAGNVTQVNLVGDSNTQAWQGYFGNVTGAIQLGDSSSNILYNWSLSSPGGEVYAANRSSVDFTIIDCFDMANGVTTLESDWNIGASDADGVNETFNLNDHAGFFTGSVEHTSGECNNTKLYNSSGVGSFDVVLLNETGGPIFASLLQEDGNGFDGDTYDFEMIVLEDGHSGDTSTDTYFFWVELS